MQNKLIVTDHSVSKEEFQLLYVKELDFYKTQPVPHNLESYYESDEYISHTDSTKTLQDKLYQLIKKINLNNKINLINKYAPATKNLLDVGAGTGDFLKQAQLNDWFIEGIEPNLKARNLALKKKIVLVPSYTDLKHQQYDVITLWHVLEHLPNLDHQIAQLENKLKSGGTLIIAVPNYKSYDAKHYKEFWAAYDVPRHLYHFSRNTINRIFSKHQFSVVTTRPMIFDSYYVSLLSEKYKSGTSNFIKAFLVGTLSNIIAFFTKEHSSIIYVLKKH